MEIRNIVKLQDLRQRKVNFNKIFERRLQVSENLIKRLGLESKLNGHTGCINSLQWNEDGNLLVSGSEDSNVMLWNPFLSKKLHTIQSGHIGSIYSVKFLPGSNDNCIISCASDCKILINDYTREEMIYSCSCHTGTVRCLATTPRLPKMFWSASQDGMICQSDLRCPHTCSIMQKNVLVNLRYHQGRSAEATCVAVNPVNSDLIAVGTNNSYVRMYDRRMIKLITHRLPSFNQPDNLDNIVPGCVSYFIAGHLPLAQHGINRWPRVLTSTYVTFSPDGKNLLTNLAGHQVYIFNIVSKRKNLLLNISEKALDHNDSKKSGEDLKMNGNGEHSSSDSNRVETNEVKHSSDCLHQCENSPTPPSQQKSGENCVLPPEVDAIEKVANKAFEDSNFTIAICLYSSAIASCPKAACLYCKRAAVYKKRAWDGDLYAATRDYLTAIELNPRDLIVHIQLVKSFLSLHCSKEAYHSLQALSSNFPKFAETAAFNSIENDVIKSLGSQKTQWNSAYDEYESSDEESWDEEEDLIRYQNYEIPVIPFQRIHIEEDEDSFPEDSRREDYRARENMSDYETVWRTSAYDYEYRFDTYCKRTRGIKEANFFGNSGEYIMAGTDHGSIYIWERVTTSIVAALQSDNNGIKCLQPHPNNCMLATSGNDPVVRLWSPQPEVVVMLRNQLPASLH